MERICFLAACDSTSCFVKNLSLKLAISDDNDDEDDNDDDDYYHNYNYDDYGYDGYYGYHYLSINIVVVVFLVAVVYDQQMILAKILKVCKMGPTILASKGTIFKKTVVV